MQLHAAIPRRRKLSPRRGKKADVSVQSRGQMDGWHCGVCGNRIYSAAAIWTCYARTHPSNFVSALPAVPTVVQRPLHGLAEWARHARTEPGEAAELWYRGTVGPIAPCLRPRRSQREAAAARCHSCVHSVWDRKKGRCKLRQARPQASSSAFGACVLTFPVDPKPLVWFVNCLGCVDRACSSLHSIRQFTSRSEKNFDRENGKRPREC
jgi:hypothetical protein